MLATLSQQAGKPLHAHITVTGGEPFARRDFLDLLKIFAAHNKRFSFGILTNGSFIDAAMAKQLSKLAPRFVQVSIEGTAATHDSIRGKGNLAQTVTAIKNLRREGIRTGKIYLYQVHSGMLWGRLLCCQPANDKPYSHKRQYSSHKLW